MSKVRVRYIASGTSDLLSSTPDHPSISFSRYGQLVELDEEVYQRIIAGAHGVGLALILDSEFSSLGHTTSELAQWGAPESHGRAPESFQDKMAAANEILKKNYLSARTPAPAEPPLPATDEIQNKE